MNLDCTRFEAPCTGTGTITLGALTLSDVMVESEQVADYTALTPRLVGTAAFGSASGQLFAGLVADPLAVPVGGSVSLVGGVFTVTGGTGVFSNLVGTFTTTAGLATFTSPAGGVGHFEFVGDLQAVPEPSTLATVAVAWVAVRWALRGRGRSSRRALRGF